MIMWRMRIVYWITNATNTHSEYVTHCFSPATMVASTLLNVTLKRTLPVLFYHGATATSGPGPPHYRGFTITLRHTTLGRTTLDERSARRRDLNLTTDNTHKRQASCSHGIRTRNPRKRVAVDPRLRPRGHRDRHLTQLAEGNDPWK